jgi:hypothetical protein
MNALQNFTRDLLAYLLAPAMRATGFRFSKNYRHGTTSRHRLVYACVNTVRANLRAENLPTYPIGKNGMNGDAK